MCKACFAGILYFARCVPCCRSQAPDALHHGRFGPEGFLAFSGSGMCKACFAGISHLALCSFFVFTPKMLGILVGMDQKDSNVQWYVSWFRAVFPSLSSGIVVAGEVAALPSTLAVARSRLVLMVTMQVLRSLRLWQGP